jgi:hypothetical protein
LAAVTALVSAAAPALGRPHIDVTGEVGPGLRVMARNTGDEPADDVVPTLLYQHRTWSGDSVRIAPGGTHDWQFALSSPDAGTFPAIVRVRYRDALGRAAGVPLVLAIGVGEEPIRATLETSPVAGSGHAELRLENPRQQAVAGRVVLVLPDGLTTEPESVPAQVPGGTTHALVPIVIQTSGAPPPGRYPVFATFEYSQDGVQHTTIAAGTVEIVGSAVAGRNLRLLVGLGALAVTFTVLAIAWRASRS